MPMIEFQTKTYGSLTKAELYKILQLRAEVFVVEQECPYQDVDGKDEHALHLIGEKAGKIVAYARLFPPGAYFEEAAIGRVVVRQDERQNGYGHLLMRSAHKAMSEHFNPPVIRISAQQYLEKFYRQHGYVRRGKGYLEDGIPHYAMVKTKI